MITKTGKLILSACFFLYLMGMQAASSLVYLMLGLILGLFIINFFEARRSCSVIRIHPPLSISCYEGDSLTQAWELKNPTPSAAGHLSVYGHFGILFTVQKVEARSLIFKTPVLTFPERGVIPFDSLLIESTFPFGLVKVSRRLQLPGEIVVYPKPYLCETPVIGGFEPVLDGCISGKNLSRSGNHFRGIRPLHSDDPIKLIHWKSSAKGLGLMVKEFDETLSGRLGLILDETIMHSKEGKACLDAAARAAASLMARALDEGHQVEASFLHQSKLLSVPPFSNGEVFLDALARIKPCDDFIDYEAFIHAVSVLPSRSSVCFILSDLNKGILEYINQEFSQSLRKVVVYLPESVRGNVIGMNVPVKFFTAQTIQEIEE